jgi:hypothetical protein
VKKVLDVSSVHILALENHINAKNESTMERGYNELTASSKKIFVITKVCFTDLGKLNLAMVVRF